MKKKLLKLCFGIISGRITKDKMQEDDFLDMGFDTYKFNYYGNPSDKELKYKAEDLIIEILFK